MFGHRRKGRRGARLDAEIEEELQFHLEQAAARYGSMRQARAALGSTEAVKEECRELRVGAWLASIGRDLSLGARILRRSSGFALIAVLTLGLCIGLTTTVFGLLDSALFQTPPFPQPDRIVAIVPVTGGGPAPYETFGAGDMGDFEADVPALAALAGYERRNYNFATRTSHGISAEHVNAMAVTPEFFRVLGVSPSRGRVFGSGEGHAAVLSDSLWQSQFGGTPVLGRRGTLDGIPYTVVGVMPRGFAEGGQRAFAASLWVPLVIPPGAKLRANPTALTMFALGRLKPGATLAEARQQVAAVAQRIAARYPREHGIRSTALTLQQRLALSSNAEVLDLILALAAFILLVGCANVAGLGLARAAARRDEMALRRALGAGRRRLIRQVWTENAWLAALAGLVGVVMGWLGIQALNASLHGGDAHFDGNVLAVALAAVGITALATGLPPALRLGSRPRPTGVVGGSRRGQKTLLGIEIGLTFASLIMIAALVLAIRQELLMPLGFQPQGVLASEISLSGPGYRTMGEQAAFLRRLRTAVAAIPGAGSVGLVSPPPTNWNEEAAIARGRTPIDWRGVPKPKVFAASAGYFHTLKIPILAGRAFTGADVAGAAPVAVISRHVARRLFGSDLGAMGRYIRLDGKGEPWRQIVGVSGDVATYEGDDRRNGEIFEPLAQGQLLGSGLEVLVRTTGSPDALIAPMRQILAGIDPTLALYDAQPLATELLASGAGNDASIGHVLELTGGLGLLLSALGLYGVVAYGAVERRRELGIRRALGATIAQLEWLVLGEGLWPVAIGLGAGGGLGWLGLRVLVDTQGPEALWPLGVPLAPLVVVPLGLVGLVAAMALYLPARKAARADPTVALRVE